MSVKKGGRDGEEGNERDRGGRGRDGGDDGPETERRREFKAVRLEARVVWGSSLMYTSTASLFHLPRDLISSLESPFALAETAAPLRKECPEKPAVGMPARRRYSWTLLIKYNVVKGVPKEHANAGELGVAGHRATRLRTAEMGHKGDDDGAR